MGEFGRRLKATAKSPAAKAPQRRDYDSDRGQVQAQATGLSTSTMMGALALRKDEPDGAIGQIHMSLFSRIRESFAGRFIEDPLFGTLCYGRERTYTVDHVTRRFEPVGWTNSWQGSMVFDPLATKIPVWIRTESEQGPTEHHREVYRQLNWRWPFLELPIAEQLIPLCHEWCKGLFNDFELSPQTAHAFYSDIIEVQGMTICDWSPSDSISDCDISFVPRKGDLGGHDFVALLRQGQLLNVVVAG